VPAAIVRVRRPELLTAPKLLARGAAAVAAPRLTLAVDERDLSGVGDAVAILRERTDVRFAITGVGGAAGSGFERLIDFPADLIGLAPRLCEAPTATGGFNPLVAEITALARELGCSTLATGVSDQPQRKLLVQAGIDLISGPLMGGEVEGSRLAALLIAQDAVVDPRPLAARPAVTTPPAQALPVPRVRDAGPPPEPPAATSSPAAPPPAPAAPAPEAEQPPPLPGGWASQQLPRKRRLPFRR